MVSSEVTCMHAATVLGALQPVPRQTCCNSFCFGRRCDGHTWPGQGPHREGRGVQEWCIGAPQRVARRRQA